MADPDWIGAPVRDQTHVLVSVDGKAVYYSLKRSGLADERSAPHRLVRGRKDSVVDGAAMAHADGAQAVFDAAGTHAAFVRNGDMFVRDLASGASTQVTRTPRQGIRAAIFRRRPRLLSFRSGNDWFVHDLASGVTAPRGRAEDGKGPGRARRSPTMLRADATAHCSRRCKKCTTTRRPRAHTPRQCSATTRRRAPAPFYLGDK